MKKKLGKRKLMGPKRKHGPMHEMPDGSMMADDEMPKAKPRKKRKARASYGY